MLDFNSNDANFRQIFTDLIAWWVAEFDVDAFRIDAVPHVTTAFMAYFSTYLRDFAASVGKDNLFLVGEVAGMRGTSQYLRDMNLKDKPLTMTLKELLPHLKPLYARHAKFPFPGLNAVYDFDTKTARESLMHNEITPSHFGQWAAHSDYNLTYATCPACFQLISLQDQPRFAWNIPQELQCDAEGLLATSYLMVLLGTPGLPLVYYGDEQGLSGTCQTIYGDPATAVHAAIHDRLIDCAFNATVRRAPLERFAPPVPRTLLHPSLSEVKSIVPFHSTASYWSGVGRG